MSLAPWRSPLASALQRNRSLSQARYVQLATVDPDGLPANRTVVFRGFRDGTNQLQFATDRRSAKVSQIDHQPWAAVCWYFPKTREQFRLRGPLQLVTAAHPAHLQTERQRLWQSLSDAARTQFAWPPPGAPYADADAFAVPPPPGDRPLPDFCLLLLAPVEVDHLELRGDPQQRQRYRLRSPSEWHVERVNP